MLRPIVKIAQPIFMLVGECGISVTSPLDDITSMGTPLVLQPSTGYHNYISTAMAFAMGRRSLSLAMHTHASSPIRCRPFGDMSLSRPGSHHLTQSADSIHHVWSDDATTSLATVVNDRKVHSTKSWSAASLRRPPRSISVALMDLVIRLWRYRLHEHRISFLAT